MASSSHSDIRAKADTVRVLIAEDEAMIALSLSDLLEAEGYEVTITSNGAEALTEAKRLGSRLDALLTDLNMPCMSGEALIRAMRVQQPGLPIVVVTGSAPIGGLEELRRQGGGEEPFALLHKPMNYDDLVETVRRAVWPKHP